MIPETQPTRLASAQPRTAKSADLHAGYDSASLMPVERQTKRYVEPAEPISRIFSEQSGLPMGQIRSIRQAPSAVTAEAFLQARAGFNPGYVQNMAATRAERISNLYADAPRFRNQIDILA